MNRSQGSRGVEVWWSGPRFGVGNRLLALAAARACARDSRIGLVWPVDDSCPVRYESLFEPEDQFVVAQQPPAETSLLSTSGWDPLDIHARLGTVLATETSQDAFCRDFAKKMTSLPFRGELLERARAWRHAEGPGELLGIHLRRTDRVAHHRKSFRSRPRAAHRVLPLWQDLMYGLLPPRTIAAVENWLLLRRVREYLSESGSRRIAVFADSPETRAAFIQQLARSGVGPTMVASSVEAPEQGAEPTRRGSRSTTVPQAIAELLSLSLCDAIGQNNGASSFSLAAALVGSKPLITPASRHLFWQALRKAEVRE